MRITNAISEFANRSAIRFPAVRRGKCVGIGNFCLRRSEAKKFYYLTRLWRCLQPNIVIGEGGYGSDSGRSNRTQCRQLLATAVMMLRRCVAQALSSGGGPRHSLDASVEFREYNKDLIRSFIYNLPQLCRNEPVEQKPKQCRIEPLTPHSYKLVTTPALIASAIP